MEEGGGLRLEGKKERGEKKEKKKKRDALTGN